MKWSICLLVGLIGVALTTPFESNPHRRKGVTTEQGVSDYKYPFVSRTEWGARKPEDVESLITPASYVIIHHSYLVKACDTRSQCKDSMRAIQDYHMDYRGWWDVGYNFGVGGDGAAYEGRGWTTLGAHTLKWNSVSIGICVIGDWTTVSPPEDQLNVVRALIDTGVKLGYIKPDYILIGHRQSRTTTKCPGTALYETIKHWSHWKDHPKHHSNTTTSDEED